VIYEENGLVIANYNVLKTQLESKPIAQLIVHYTTVKLFKLWKNRSCQKTYHNRKREEPTILVVPIKVVEPITKVIAQPIKPAKVPLKC
jgi:hypothetical protein